MHILRINIIPLIVRILENKIKSIIYYYWSVQNVNKNLSCFLQKEIIIKEEK